MEHFSKFSLLGTNDWKRRTSPADYCAAISDPVIATAQNYMIATAEQYLPGRGRELYMLAARSALHGEMEEATHSMMVMCSDLVGVLLTTKNRMVRDVVLAHLCGRVSRGQLNDLILHAKTPAGGGIKPVTKAHMVHGDRYKRGRQLHEKLLKGEELSPKVYASRMSDVDGIAMLDFIRLNCPLGVKAGVVRKVRVGGNAYDFCPLVRSMNLGDFWRKYVAWKAAAAPVTEDAASLPSLITTSPPLATTVIDAATSCSVPGAKKDKKKWTPGRYTFMAFLKYVTIEAKKKECLSYYYVGLLDAFGMYDRLLARHEEIHDVAVDKLRVYLRETLVSKMGPSSKSVIEAALLPLLKQAASLLPLKSSVTRKRSEAAEVLKYAKSHLSSHLVVDRHDPVGVHCCLHAVGGCDEEHHGSCHECEKTHKYGDSMWSFMNSNTNALLRALEKSIPEFAAGRKVSYESPTTKTMQPKMPGFYAKPTTTQTTSGDKEEAAGVDEVEDAGMDDEEEAGPEWAQCDRCTKWRILPDDVDSELLPDVWVCKDASSWRPGISCATPQDKAVKKSNVLEASLPAVDTAMPPAPLVPVVDEPPVCNSEPVQVVEPASEGHLRRELIEIVTLVHNMRGCTGHWASHNARGAWQESAIAKMYQSLQTIPNFLIATIDMKSKTTAAKHRTDQGFGFGLRGMSIQGAMLERWRVPADGGPPYREVSYIDIVYSQSSNQSLEEAMSGVDIMMAFIRANYDGITEVQIISDKCANFNSF
jgi:hypothetical protein